MKYYLVRKLFEKLRKQKEGNAGVRYEKAEILQKPLFIEEYFQGNLCLTHKLSMDIG